MKILIIGEEEEQYLDGVVLTERELEPIDFILVYWIRIDYSNVHKPFLEVVRFYECNTGWKVVAQLKGRKVSFVRAIESSFRSTLSSSYEIR